MPMRLLWAALFTLLCAPAQAHPGHGAVPEWHWHATDAWGFVVVAMLVGLAVWLSRRK